MYTVVMQKKQSQFKPILRHTRYRGYNYPYRATSKSVHDRYAKRGTVDEADVSLCRVCDQYVSWLKLGDGKIRIVIAEKTPYGFLHDPDKPHPYTCRMP